MFRGSESVYAGCVVDRLGGRWGAGRRYAVRRLFRAGYQGDRVWGPYDQDRQRFVGQAVFTHVDAQQLADQVNVSGVDWTYAEDIPLDRQAGFGLDRPAH